MDKTTKLKKNAPVNFVSRGTSGTGKFDSKTTGPKGDYYVIKQADGKSISLRASQITPI